MRVAIRSIIVAVCCFVVAAALGGCARHFDVPTPNLDPSTSASIPALEPATIVVPITISMASLKVRLDSVFPLSDSLDRANCSALGGLVCHQYVYRRDSLDVQMLNDRISLETHLGFRARVGLPGGIGVASCGYDPEPAIRAELHLATTLYWREDWRLSSRATVVAPTILDKCEITVLRVDATPVIKTMLDGQLARLQHEVDSIVPAVADFKPLADSLWRDMQQPFPLDSTSMVWFAMLPDRANLAPLVGTGAVAATAMVLSAHPRVTVGSVPPAGLLALPKLSLMNPGPGIHVPVEIELPFDELSRRATALLAGEVAGKGITVHDVKVWGIGDTAVVRVDLTGRVTGSLFLLGRVGYDHATRSVLIPDLRYTLASAGKMSSIKATLGAGRIRAALDAASGHGRMDIGAQFDRVKAELGSWLNRELAPGTRVSGGISDVRIDRLYATATAFVVRVVFDGEAKIDITK